MARQWRRNWRPALWNLSLPVSIVSLFSKMFGCCGIFRVRFIVMGCDSGVLYSLIGCSVFVSEFEELVTRVEASLEQASPSRRRTRTESSRSRFRSSMVKDLPVFELFVSVAMSEVETAFFCTLCQRDVSIAAKGEREMTRHFGSDKHWLLDVTYRVHQGLQVYIKLLEPMESQTQEYLARPFKEKPEGFSFPEDMLPSCTRVDSSLPLITMINCLIEMLRSGGTTFSCANCGVIFGRHWLQKTPCTI